MKRRRLSAVFFIHFAELGEKRGHMQKQNKMLTVRVSQTILRKLNAHRRKVQRSQGEIVRTALTHYLETTPSADSAPPSAPRAQRGAKNEMQTA